VEFILRHENVTKEYIDEIVEFYKHSVLQAGVTETV